MCYIKTKLTEADVILLHLLLMMMFLTSKAFGKLVYNLFQSDRKSPFSSLPLIKMPISRKLAASKSSV